MEVKSMEQYNRLAIDAIKQAFAYFVAKGGVDTNALDTAHRQLNFELDRRVVAKEPTEEIEALIKDILWVKYDLLGAQC